MKQTGGCMSECRTHTRATPLMSESTHTLKGGLRLLRTFRKCAKPSVFLVDSVIFFCYTTENVVGREYDPPRMGRSLPQPNRIGNYVG